MNKQQMNEKNDIETVVRNLKGYELNMAYKEFMNCREGNALPPNGKVMSICNRIDSKSPNLIQLVERELLYELAQRHFKERI